jgi:hypothetical protein
MHLPGVFQVVGAWLRFDGAMPMRRRSENDLSAETLELAALADGSLTAERRADLEARVAASPELSEQLAEQQHALTLTRSAVADTEAPAGLRRRIEAGREARNTRGRRRIAIAGAAAAVAAIAVGVVAFGVGGGPDAPGASGKATLTRHSSGWQIELDANGLPRLTNGAFYEAWLRDDAGLLVPIGTFNDGRDVTLWAGVAPDRFATLTVTRERADGNQSSSGEKVLVGTMTRRG